jgi:hypothetical protein
MDVGGKYGELGEHIRGARGILDASHKSRAGGCISCRATGTISTADESGRRSLSLFTQLKSLFGQGWKAFSSQSYQGG